MELLFSETMIPSVIFFGISDFMLLSVFLYAVLSKIPPLSKELSINLIWFVCSSMYLTGTL